MKEIWVDSKAMAKKLRLRHIDEKGKWTEVSVRGARDIGKIREAGREGAERIIILSENWASVPLKELVSVARRISLIAKVKNSDEARAIPPALEKSLSGFFMPQAKEKEIDCLRRFMAGEGAILLERARITGTRKTDHGERSCIDTCEILHDSEGMLVGSEATGFFLVQTKSYKESTDPDACPFRVKAGAVSLYTLMEGGKTRFLGDIKAGEDVFIVDSAGKGRKALVGRNRIERRPMILVEAKAGGRTIRALLQDSGSVHLAKANGSKSVTSLKKGDEVLVHLRGQKQSTLALEK